MRPTVYPNQTISGQRLQSKGESNQVAYCGIRCREACPDYKYPSLCSSCKSEDEKHSSFWERCMIRKCAVEKQVVTCAHCDEYPTCDDPMWESYPWLRRQIDQIRSNLEAGA